MAISEQNDARSSLWPWPVVIAGIYLLAHILTASRYGYFRDALYYLACSEHLAWGYVDQPPLIAFVTWFARHTTGTSLPGLLIWPALAGCARILFAAAFARELNAKRFGVALAAFLGAAPLVWYVIDHQLAMNAFEPIFVIGAAYALVRMINGGSPRWWLAFGVLAGIGLENKYSMAIFAFSMLAGLLLTRERKLFFTPWLLAGGAAACLIFLPNFLWNVHHHWPFLELMRNIRESGKDVVLSPGAFLAQQILLANPLALPFWLGGLAWYFFSPRAKGYRAFGWAFVFAVGFFLVAHGKNYYTMPIYTVVLASGAVAAEGLLQRASLVTRPSARAALASAMFACPLVGILLLLPVVLPVLPVETYLRYQAHLPFPIPHSEVSHEGAPLPQHYADEFGWPEMVAAVARVYHSLPPEQQGRTAIFTRNYGQAGAIDFFGPRYGLPKAICAHQSYFLWGPRNYTGEIMILVGEAHASDVHEKFDSVEVAATLDNPYALFYETRPILLARGLHQNLQTLWPKLKFWY